MPSFRDLIAGPRTVIRAAPCSSRCRGGRAMIGACTIAMRKQRAKVFAPMCKHARMSLATVSAGR
jgi:hypothetical protein